MMGGDGDLPHRSSSPLKRRASYLEPDGSEPGAEPAGSAAEDVEMLNGATPEQESEPDEPGAGAPGGRAMSIDPPDNDAAGRSTSTNTAGSTNDTLIDGRSGSRDPLIDAGSGSRDTLIAAGSGAKEAAAPPMRDQIVTIQSLLKLFANTPILLGDKAYLVSRAWLNKALALSGDPAYASKDIDPTQPLGPVDNSAIVWEYIQLEPGHFFVRLLPGTDHADFELFPKDAWDYIIEWHGLAPGQRPIVRVATQNSVGELSYEFHPMVWKIYRVWSELTPWGRDQPDRHPLAPVLMVRSKFDRFQATLREIKRALGIPEERRVRLWTVAQPQAGPAQPGPAVYLDHPSAGLTPPPESESPTQGANNHRANSDVDNNNNSDVNNSSSNNNNTNSNNKNNNNGAASSSSSVINNGYESGRDPWASLLIEVPTFLALIRGLERVMVDGVRDETNNPNYNGKSLNETFISTDTILVVDEETGRDNFVTTGGGRSGVVGPVSSASKGRAVAVATAAAGPSGRSGSSDGSNSPPPPPGPMTRGRSAQKRRAGGRAGGGSGHGGGGGGGARPRGARSDGVVGFQNLGNTCYMNSALQCIRSVEELTKYFMSGEYRHEINEENPLGYGGQVAHSYGKLLREVYDEGRQSVAPRSFKGAVGRARPTFAGWGQQDSQEFLGFMLDALQEDLSRVRKKPYIPKPDSTDDMIDNPAAIRAMADQVWDITRRRDDSVIADLFTGMYKSTLKCPVCDKISITFDPFNNLTLPLPVENVMSFRARFFPLNDPPIDMEVEVARHSAIEALKQFVSARTGVPTDRLIGAEEFKDKFFKPYNDSADVSDEIQAGDLPNFYELEAVPTNWPPKHVSGGGGAAQSAPSVRSMLDTYDEPWEDPRSERLAVTVIHRIRDRNWAASRRDSVTPPHFIILTREEAWNEDIIRRKILEKIATFSTWSQLSSKPDPDPDTDSDHSPDHGPDTDNDDNSDTDRDEDADDDEDDADEDADGEADPADPEELVVTTVSDVDSAGDSKVVAHSVEGEDDLVDVIMKERPADGEDKHRQRQQQQQQQPQQPQQSKRQQRQQQRQQRRQQRRQRQQQKQQKQQQQEEEEDNEQEPMSPRAKPGATDDPLKRFNSRRPKIATERAEPLPAIFRSLFEMYYFTEKDSILATGWTSVSDHSNHPTVSSRAPPRPAAEPASGEGGQSPSSSSGVTGSDDGDDESADELALDQPATTTTPSSTRMADESSDDDDDAAGSGAPPPPSISSQRHAGNSHRRGKNGGKRGGGNKKKFKAHNSYGKKGNKRRNQQAQHNNQHQVRSGYQRLPPQPEVSPPPQPQPGYDGGPLIRYGEGIIVEWSEESHSLVYDRDERCMPDLRGGRTFGEHKVPVLRDVGLEQRRHARATRRKRGLTLDECLDEFEKAEVLSEQDMWYCPRCKEHRRASKKFDLWKTPDILVCHLKRFSTAGYRRDKLDVLVEFPVEGLNLTERVVNRVDGTDEVYDLIAIDDHFGGLGGGHYTAYAKSFSDGSWYCFNDSHVTLVNDLTDLVSSAAYLLFYRRRSDAPLGGPRFARILERYEECSDDPDEADADADADPDADGDAESTGSGREGRPRASRGGGSSPRQSAMSSAAPAAPASLPPPYSASEPSSGTGFQDEAIGGMADEATTSARAAGKQPMVYPPKNWNWANLDREPDRETGQYSAGGAEINSSGDEMEALLGLLTEPGEEADGNHQGTAAIADALSRSHHVSIDADMDADMNAEVDLDADTFTDLVSVTAPEDPAVTEIYLEGPDKEPGAG